jgi:Na+-translocating ferredoxin:NAD+ oxidoreductase RNF subunit RnfB
MASLIIIVAVLLVLTALLGAMVSISAKVNKLGSSID